LHVHSASGAMSFCGACWYLFETLEKEACATVADLRDRREALFGRVADLLTRTGVEDAPRLIRELEKL